jgi:copper chaperone CopZ
MNNISLNVSGIANSQMKTSLKNALDKIPGIQSVNIDKFLGTVAVGYNDPANEHQIQGCIEETGFKIV